MIAEIHLKNFKRFLDLKLKTQNLTVLTGGNSSGKTSILHSLLLVRQIVRDPNKSHVELNGIDTLELGEVEDIIHRGADSELATVELLDMNGNNWHWSFGAMSNDDVRTLSTHVNNRPDNYTGVLAGSAPQFYYLCAERLGPRDVLSTIAANATELDVGSRGQFVAQVLAASYRMRISPGRIENSSAESPPDLLHQTESWMSKIVHPILIEAIWFPNTSVTRLRFKSPGRQSEWTRSPNTGFGISYALPIVVAALCAEEGGLLLVENPEAHLHPAGQSKIGGFLAQIAADGVQVILETHSDHVLNGIRVAVSNDSTECLQENVVVHYFLPENKDNQVVQSLELNQTGQLSAWPAGFFDQTQIDLATLVSKRRRNL